MTVSSSPASMDRLIQFFVELSCVLIFIECCTRLNVFGYQFRSESPQYWEVGGEVFFIAYLLCLAGGLVNGLTNESLKSKEVKSALSYLHGLDGFAAALIGISLYYRSLAGLIIGIVIITKVFLISLMNRMILGSTSADTNIFGELAQTTKSFLHHVASFLFLVKEKEILMTACWRAISMSGHASLVLRNSTFFSKEQVNDLNWKIAHIRNLYVCYVLFSCMTNLEIRESFGRSAVGHISYMVIRLGPVFQLGSIYMDADEKRVWKTLTEIEKLKALFIERQHVWLTVELCLLLFTTFYFAFLRIQLLTAEFDYSPYYLPLLGGQSIGSFRQLH